MILVGCAHDQRRHRAASATTCSSSRGRPARRPRSRRHPRPGLVLRSGRRLGRRPRPTTPASISVAPGRRRPDRRGRASRMPGSVSVHDDLAGADLRHRRRRALDRRPAAGRTCPPASWSRRRPARPSSATGLSPARRHVDPPGLPGGSAFAAGRGAASLVVRSRASCACSTTRVTNSGGSRASIAAAASRRRRRSTPTSSGPAAPPRVIRNCSSAKPRPRRLAGTTSAEAAVRFGIAPAKPDAGQRDQGQPHRQAGQQHGAGERDRAEEQEAERGAQPPGRTSRRGRGRRSGCRG